MPRPLAVNGRADRGAALPGRPARGTRGARRGRPVQGPEDSILLRVVVAAITVLSVGAVVAEGAVDPATAAAAFVLIPLGSWLAYRRRGARNRVLKWLLAAGLLASLFGFLALVSGARDMDEARATLGSLFVWVQVLHTFDLPRRRDLAFSVVASVALMAQAGSLSLDAGFGLFLLPYAVLVGVWLFMSDRARAREGSGDARLERGIAPNRIAARVAPVRAVALSLLVAAVAGGAVFAFTPRLPGGLVVAPPFSLAHRVSIPGFSGAVVNPDMPARAGEGTSGAVRGAGYPGFGSEVDLRVRGTLSDRLVMRVRSPQGAFWRGQAYDTFDGTTWTASETDIREVEVGFSQAIHLPPAEPSVAPTRSVLQTFFIVRRQPNLVFAAAQAREVYFPASRLAVDRYGSIRAPIILEPETIYSVVSEVPVTPPSMLRAAPPEWPQEFLRQYTQLPPSLPGRVVELAGRITRGKPTAYDKVQAVQRWLEANTRYRLDIPPDPPGVDAVDHFLFERREGFCEHLASAMVVLLRASGIPARFAVGFDAGRHNLLTGYHEVRESDAHSWVEVHYPGVGWVEYDPTHGVPAAAPGLWDRFPGLELFAAIGRFLTRVVPDPVREAVGSFVGLGRLVASRWPLVTGILLVAGAVLLLARRRRRRRRDPPPVGAANAFASMCRTFRRRGHPRPAHRTPSEHLEALLASEELAPDARADVRTIVRTYERDRFGGSPPARAEVAESLAAAARLRRR